MPLPTQWRKEFVDFIQIVHSIEFNSIKYNEWLKHLIYLTEFVAKYGYELDDDLLWVDCGPYYLYLAPQRSEPWKEIRKGRVTGSRAAEACGLSMYHKCPDFQAILPTEISLNTKKKYYARDKSINTTASEIAGNSVQEFSSFTLNVMQHGTDTEPIVHDKHQKYIKGEVLELPLAVPKWCKYMGVSVDGYLMQENGIAEYKAPQRMYDSLEYMLGLAEEENKLLISELEGIIIKESKLPVNYNLIPINHLIQQILGMEVFDKDFSDYVVYDAVKEHYITYVRIPRQKELWQKVLWPTIQKFIKEHLRPILQNKYPICPPNWID